MKVSSHVMIDGMMNRVLIKTGYGICVRLDCETKVFRELVLFLWARLWARLFVSQTVSHIFLLSQRWEFICYKIFLKKLFFHSIYGFKIWQTMAKGSCGRHCFCGKKVRWWWYQSVLVLCVSILDILSWSLTLGYSVPIIPNTNHVKRTMNKNE